MKFGNAMWIPAARYAALLVTLSIAAPLMAQTQTAQPGEESRYILKDLGTFGGPGSGVNGNTVVLNNQGTVVGGADTAHWNRLCKCHTSHAFKWARGVLKDLGTLPRGNHFSYAIAINSSGAIAGVSNNGVIDPTSGETFVATEWRKSGEIVNLGTLGGLWSLPYSINDRGQMVGGAENTIPDPDNLSGAFTGNLPAPTLWRAALWQNGTIQDLGTLGGPAAFAFFINESGQVAGLSYTNSITADIHPFFWENGQMTDIGTLGGSWTDVMGMNNRGQVVGQSVTSSGEQHAYRWSRGRLIDLGTLGGNFSFATAINDHGWIIGASAPNSQDIDGFLWRNGVMTDLGKLSKRDICNVAFSVNSRGQVVGESGDCDHGGQAWIWENGGPMVDLNTLVPPGSNMHLVEAEFINDRGEIAGHGRLPNGKNHAFLLIPRKPQ